MKPAAKRIWFGVISLTWIFLWVVQGGLPTLTEAAQFSPMIAITEDKTSQGFPYMFGGISSDERDAMEERAKGYNLKLVFAERRGAFVSGVSLHIGTAKGGEIASLTVEGPWFYIQLPPGDYSAKARLKGELKEIKNLTVPKDKKVQQTLIWDLGES